MQITGKHSSYKLPNKISVRVLKQTFPKSKDISYVNQQTTQKVIKNYPPCHIETDKDIQEPQQLFKNQVIQTCTSQPKRRRKIFGNRNRNHRENTQNSYSKQREQSLSHDNNSRSPTFNSIGSKTHYRVPEQSSNIFYGEQTIKNTIQLNKSPTVKDISPQIRQEKYDSGIKNTSLKLLNPNSSEYLSPSKYKYQSPQKPSKQRISELKYKQIMQKISKLQKSQLENSKQVMRLDDKISNYYRKSQQSQNIVLNQLNRSSHRLINQQKQIQNNMITIRNLNNQSLKNKEEVDHLKLQLQRSKRVQKLSMQNQKLYQSLTKNQSKTTYDQTSYENYRNSKIDHQNQSYTQNYAFDLFHNDHKNHYQIKVKTPTQLRRNAYDFEQIQNDGDQVGYFPNSISDLHSPLQQGLYEHDERNDTINQLLSPLCINPDRI